MLCTIIRWLIEWSNENEWTQSWWVLGLSNRYSIASWSSEWQNQDLANVDWKPSKEDIRAWAEAWYEQETKRCKQCKEQQEQQSIITERSTHRKEITRRSKSFKWADHGTRQWKVLNSKISFSQRLSKQLQDWDNFKEKREFLQKEWLPCSKTMRLRLG